MSRLILQMQTSADGFVRSADTSSNWQLWDWGPDCPWDAGLASDYNASFLKAACVVLSSEMAREGFADHWDAMANARSGDPAFAFAHRLTAMHKVVLTSRSGLAFRGLEVAQGPVAEGIRRLKQHTVGDILAFGGVRFAQALLAARAVDILYLYVNPTAVGSGDSPFPPHQTTQLSLIKSVAYPCGMVVTQYRPNA